MSCIVPCVQKTSGQAVCGPVTNEQEDNASSAVKQLVRVYRLRSRNPWELRL